MPCASKQVGAKGRLVDDIKDILQKVSPFSGECCIFKVPVYQRSVNHACYTPKLISLGPIHHGDEKLQSMETYKVRYLHVVIDLHIDVEDMIECLRDLEEKARGYYEEDFTSRFESDEFVKMMLLDGCFIIMFLLLRIKSHEIDKDDPIFFTRSLSDNIFFDMLLLENQLPYFVLEELYYRISRCSYIPLSNYSFSQATSIFLEDRVRKGQLDDREVKHFVDYILHHKKPSEINPSKPSQDREKIYLPSATELRQSGIKFSSTTDFLLDIRFTNGVIEIPSLRLVDNTEEQFRNLIAMEQYRKDGTSYITDYMHLMDHLINTPHDVALLRSCGIINNDLGSDEDVIQLYNNMVKGVMIGLKESHYYQLIEKVNVHYNKRWHLWKAKLRQDYFNTPWAIVSFIAAAVLLICTLVQTVFSVLE